MLIKLTELKKFLNVSDTDQDPVLYDCLTRAHTEAETYCNRQFELAMRTEYYKGSIQEPTIQLDNYPLVQSGVYSLLIYDDIDLSWGADTLIAASEYQVDEAWGTVTKTSSYFQTPVNPEIKNVKVIYGAGYTETTIPQDLRLAILKLAGADYKNADTYVNAVTQSVETTGVASDLREQAYAILDNYKRWR